MSRRILEMKVISKIFLSVLFILILMDSMAQDSALNPNNIRHFDYEQLESEYLSKEKYIYDENIHIRGNLWTKVKDWFAKEFFAIFDKESDSAYRIFALIIAGLTLTISLYYLTSNRFSSFFKKTENKNVPIKQTQLEKMKENDLHALLKQAVKEDDFQLIIRLRYLLILKEMSQKKLIKWQSYKTNLDYFFELKDDDIRAVYNRIVDWYEYSWYGDFEIDSNLFHKAEQDFEILANLVKS